MEKTMATKAKKPVVKKAVTTSAKMKKAVATKKPMCKKK